MKDAETEIVGKVFLIVRGGRKCLICDGVFTAREAAEHAEIVCYPGMRTCSSPDPSRAVCLDKLLYAVPPCQH